MSSSDTDLKAVGGSIPEGGIIMWSGSVDNVPDGWTLCDGTDGAPDLKNRFVAGAGGAYSVGETGGAAQVQLSVSEIPPHSHTVSNIGPNSKPYSPYGDSGAYDTGGTMSTDSAGGDEAHENRPPFYALAYIMRTPA